VSKVDNGEFGEGVYKLKVNIHFRQNRAALKQSQYRT